MKPISYLLFFYFLLAFSVSCSREGSTSTASAAGAAQPPQAVRALPASLADVPLDFDTLAEHGAFVGSMAVVVLGQHDRARDAALNLMRFFEHESCGQCTPCRAGTGQLVRLMQSPAWDGARMDELSAVMREASICGLGQAAPNPVDSVRRFFPHEVKS